MNYFKLQIEESKRDLREEFRTRILKRFKPNNLNSLSSFTDSLVNLAVIFQYFYKETITSYNMYYLAILLDPDNVVANVDFNNYLRENNLKEKSDRYIIARISYDCYMDDSNENEVTACNDITVKQYKVKNYKSDNNTKLEKCFENLKDITVQQFSIAFNKKISFVSMKWGNRYNSEYVNKLFRGLKRNTNRNFTFSCITDNPKGLDSEIIPLELKTDFKGWMRKSILFSQSYLNKLTSNNEDYICFIDLDMIIYNSIDFIWEYEGVCYKLIMIHKQNFI